MSNPATDELLGEIQELIREREREGVAGLAERIGPSEWAALVPQLHPAEVAVLFQDGTGLIIYFEIAKPVLRL